MEDWTYSITFAVTARPACHHPRKRVIQYSREADDRTAKPRRTGSLAFAGDDNCLGWRGGNQLSRKK
jgi:hypothetical protein